MSGKCSRREFMVKGTVGLGAAVALELNGFTGFVRSDGPLAMASEGGKENNMPHVCVKLWPGRSEEDKQRLADAITEDIVRYTGASESSVTVAIEEVPPGEWKEKVYEPEIRDKAETLYKKPGYSM